MFNVHSSDDFLEKMYVGLVWSYGGQVASAYLDLYRFLKFALRRTNDVIIYTDVQPMTFTPSQVQVLHRIHHLPLEYQNYLSYYQQYLRYPLSLSEMTGQLSQLTNVSFCYYSGHGNKEGYQTPVGQLPVNFIYSVRWSKLVLMIDCCYPPDYQLPHVWTDEYYFDRSRWLSTLHNTHLHGRHLVVICPPFGKVQLADVYGSCFTRSILLMLDHSSLFMRDKQQHYPTYMITSNRRITDRDLPLYHTN